MSNGFTYRFKKFSRQLATAIVPSKATLPILAGPARGVQVPRDIAIAYPSLILGKYERAVTKAILSIRRPIHIAYDIGAHVGLTSVVLARAFTGDVKVIAFEPASGNISSLASLIAANPRLQICAIPLALSDRDGEVEFHHFQGSSMGLLQTVAAPDDINANNGDNEIVQATTLDLFVFDQGYPAPDFIKIDVEGAEGLVLTGGLQTITQYHPVLLIELHGPVHAASVYELLTSMAYRWTYIRPEIGPIEQVLGRSHLLKYFGPGDRWTQHFLLQ